MATYVIGDVQGCLESLERLLDRLSFSPNEDRLWFTGDLVNRGPHSLEVLRLVRELDAVSVLGNHDLHLLAVAYGHTSLKRQDTLKPILRARDREALLDWLVQRPLLHRGEGFTLIHAGLPPQWTVEKAQGLAREVESVLQGPLLPYFLRHMYGDRPDRWDDELSGLPRWRFIVNCLTRLRYCDPQGRLGLSLKGPPGSQPPPFVPWFEVPGRASKGHPILFGHWAALGFHRGEDVFGLDSGCVWGGRLTALRLEDLRVFQVPCAGCARRQKT